jgi:hypothetical protein
MRWPLQASRSSPPTAINGRARGLDESRQSCFVVATSVPPAPSPDLLCAERRRAPRSQRDARIARWVSLKVAAGGLAVDRSALTGVSISLFR